MLKRLLFILLNLQLLMTFTGQAFAASETSIIKIGVVIKAKQQCNFNYSLENSFNSHNFYTNAASCEMKNHTLKQHLTNQAYANTIVQEGNRYRVFMTVQ